MRWIVGTKGKNLVDDSFQAKAVNQVGEFVIVGNVVQRNTVVQGCEGLVVR